MIFNMIIIRSTGASRPAAPRAGGGGARATNGAGGGSAAQAQAQIEDLNNQMMDMKLTVEGLEKERDFYFGKYLRVFTSIFNSGILLSNKLQLNLMQRWICKFNLIHFVNYFSGKLRDVEVLCQENEGVGGEIVRKVTYKLFSYMYFISFSFVS